jgi:hypothetical protein
MTCPLCGRRKARRACPALGHDICAVCCGTKRLAEIRCPSGCGYLAAAREHPPAVTVRQHQRDVGVVVQSVRDLNDGQSQLFLLVVTFIAGYTSPELQPLTDMDTAEAAEALAATFETASRGVIYEHRPASAAANRLAAALRVALDEAGRDRGTSFGRDAAVVLRRVALTAKELGAGNPENGRPFLDMLRRVIKADRPESPAEPEHGAPRLIVP